MIKIQHARFRTPLTPNVTVKSPDRLPAPDLLLLSGVGLLLIVTEVVAGGVPVLLSSLDVVTGYKREATVCIGLDADDGLDTSDGVVDVKNAVMEEDNDTCAESGSLRGLNPS